MPLEELPLLFGIVSCGRSSAREVFSCCESVALVGTGLRFMVPAATAGGISMTEGRLVRRGPFVGGDW